MVASRTSPTCPVWITNVETDGDDLPRDTGIFMDESQGGKKVLLFAGPNRLRLTPSRHSLEGSQEGRL